MRHFALPGDRPAVAVMRRAADRADDLAARIAGHNFFQAVRADIRDLLAKLHSLMPLAPGCALAGARRRGGQARQTADLRCWLRRGSSGARLDDDPHWRLWQRSRHSSGRGLDGGL